MRGRAEQIAEVADRVLLDIVHVPQASKRRLVQPLSSECIEVDAGRVEPLARLSELIDIHTHVRSRDYRVAWMTISTSRAGV